MNVLDKNPNTISNYLQARNVLESGDYLGRPLKGGEKKRLSKYLLRMNPFTKQDLTAQLAHVRKVEKELLSKLHKLEQEQQQKQQEEQEEE